MIKLDLIGAPLGVLIEMRGPLGPSATPKPVIPVPLALEVRYLSLWVSSAAHTDSHGALHAAPSIQWRCRPLPVPHRRRGPRERVSLPNQMTVVTH